DSAAKPDAGLCPGYVIEPITIETANFDVFNRLRLDGKIGRLHCRNRRHACRGAQENPPHYHLHINPHLCVMKSLLSLSLATAGDLAIEARRSSIVLSRIPLRCCPRTTLALARASDQIR